MKYDWHELMLFRKNVPKQSITEVQAGKLISKVYIRYVSYAVSQICFIQSVGQIAHCGFLKHQIIFGKIMVVQNLND